MKTLYFQIICLWIVVASLVWRMERLEKHAPLRPGDYSWDTAKTDLIKNGKGQTIKSAMLLFMKKGDE